MIHHHRHSESETHQLRGECFSDIETLHVRRRMQRRTDAPAHHHHLLRRHHIVFCSLPEPSHALGQEEGAHAPARSDSARASSRIDIDPRQPLACQALEARDKTGRSRSDSLLLCAQDRGSRTCTLLRHVLTCSRGVRGSREWNSSCQEFGKTRRQRRDASRTRFKFDILAAQHTCQ